MEGVTLAIDQLLEQREFQVGLGERLKQLRRKAGWTQHELARRLDLQRSIVAAYETGRTLPSVPVLKKMGQVLQVSTDFLLFDDSDRTGQLQDKELLSYLTKIDALDRRERTMVKDFMDSVLARTELEALKRAGGRRQKKAA